MVPVITCSHVHSMVNMDLRCVAQPFFDLKLTLPVNLSKIQERSFLPMSSSVNMAISKYFEKTKIRIIVLWAVSYSKDTVYSINFKIAYLDLIHCILHVTRASGKWRGISNLTQLNLTV